jgi:hypothetical protein
MPGQDVQRRTGVRPHRACPVGTRGWGPTGTVRRHHGAMIQGMGRRLRLALESNDGSNVPDESSGLPPSIAGADAAADGAMATPGPLVDFVAYADDCTLSGQIRMGHGRLTDLLNDHDAWQLVNVMAESFDGAELVESTEVVIPRHDIIVVHATGPRGSNEQRHRTNLHPVVINAGRLRIRGYLHARPGLDPLAVIQRSRTMVPLTDASIEYAHHGVWERRKVGTIVINRDRIELIERAADHEVEVPELLLSTP